MNERKKNQIGRKLMAMIIAFSSLITFFITAVQLFWDYQEQRSDLEQILAGVSVNVPTISGSVWSFDEEQILLSLEGLGNLRNIEYVEVVTEDKKQKWSFGAQVSQDVVTRSYPLTYTKRVDPIVIGQLKVVASLDEIYERVFSKALGILGSNAIKTFFVAMFMFAIFYKFVAKRIEELAGKVKALEKEFVQDDDEADLVTPDTGDEINQVQDSFDRMAYRLRKTMADLQNTNVNLSHAYEEVQAINAELELRVQERTEHLRQEIVEREYIQTSLKESEQRLRDIAESASDWFWEIGPDLTFSYVSDRCYQVTGLKKEEVIGKSRFDMAADYDDSESVLWDEYQAAVEQRLPIVNFRYRLKIAGGDFIHVELNGSPVHSSDGVFMGYRGAARDVSEQIRQEQKLKNARDRADQANVAKSEFISRMSHELRTPLNGILGFAQLLQMNPKKSLNEQEDSYIKQILHAGNHLLNLINEILDLAKVEAGKVQMSMEKVSPRKLLQEDKDILEALAKQYNVSLNLHVREVSEDILVNADVTRFKQVVMNLCSNAIKYNKSGGQVDVKLERRENGWLRVSIVDTGPGIAEEDFGKLFTPFDRLTAEGSEVEGTGVGLSITHKLVELMFGHLGVESELGVGSTFWFELDAAEVDSNGFVDHENTGLNTQELQPCFVLYVEDNEDNRTLVEEIFNRFDGAELVAVSNGEDGISAANKSDFDLILLDLNLPKLSGFDVLQQLRQSEQTASVPVLAVSADAHSDTINKCYERGFQGYLSKPVNISELIKEVNKHINA